jgi:peptide/nickel transport system permease protein
MILPAGARTSMTDSAPKIGGARRAMGYGRVRRWPLAVLQHPVLIVVVRRLVLSVPVLFLVSMLVFLLTSLLPGNVTWTILGPPDTSGVPIEKYELLAHDLGVDRPLPVQYWHWLSGAVHGDLGQSLFTKQAITQAITDRFPVTLSLVLGALVISVVVGVLLGVVSAVQGGVVGSGVDVLAMFGWVVPGFWLAAQLVVVFALVLGWFPAIGYVPITQSPEQWFRSLVLPWAALSVAGVGLFAKFTREAMLDALSSEYILMARANGIARASITFRHAFKTASLQVVTQAGMFTIALLIGTVFVEVVFAMPGMGSLMVSSTLEHDLPMVHGVAIFFTLIVILVNLTTDVLYGVLSPKVRIQ